MLGVTDENQWPHLDWPESTPGNKTAQAQALSRNAAGNYEGAKSCWRHTQGAVENEKDKRHLLNGHWTLASEPRVEVSICLSWGMVLPKCGYSASALGDNSLCRGASGRRGATSSSTGTSAFC
jgi:hypothetical protein